MPNPFLPLWEYIPDGEPRVFGNRVYLYGSHDRASSDSFCDYKLKVWSALLSDLNHWHCHGDSFHTRKGFDYESDTDWTDKELYAPDVVCKDGNYYLYAYIFNSKGCVGVSNRPEGPFSLLSTYIYHEDDAGDDGIFNDPGVLIDNDGRVYIYYGYEKLHFGELNSKNMFEIKKGSYRKDFISCESNLADFLEASSPRKINDKYYLIYSPKQGSCLDYAVSNSPNGPFVHKGTIIDNSIDYPGGNNHGSICNINGQWYIFYHRMTNGTIMSRRACVEKIEISRDGTISQVEMTSLGFENSLNPYQITPAEIACVLKGGCFITEKDYFTRTITNIKSGNIVGYKYFDFGQDFNRKTMMFSAKVVGCGCQGKIQILIDNYENGEEIGTCHIGTHDGTYYTRVKNVTGRHSVFLKINHAYNSWFSDTFNERTIFELEAFTFMK